MNNLNGLAQNYFKTAVDAKLIESGLPDIFALLSILWRRKIVLTATTLLCMLIGFFYAFYVATPYYSATASAILDIRHKPAIGLDSAIGGLSGDSTVMNSETEVLKSLALIEVLAERMDLFSDPEFAPPQPGLPSRVQQAFPIKSRDADIVLSAADQNRLAREDTLHGILRVLDIRKLPNSLVFNVTATTTDPRKSAEMADTLIRVYRDNQMTAKADSLTEATDWLSERVINLSANLQTAERLLKSFQLNSKLVDVATLDAMERQMKDLRRRITEQQQMEIAAKDRISALEHLAATTPENPKTALVRQREALLSQARNDAQLAASQLFTLTAAETELGRRTTQQADELIRLRQLTRDAEANREIYEYFLKRLKETSVQSGLQVADSRSLSHATLSTHPTIAQAWSADHSVGAGWFRHWRGACSSA